MARIAEMGAEAERKAEEAKDDVEAIQKMAEKATVSLPTALASVDDAREAARQAFKDEKYIRRLHDQLYREGRQEAFRMLPKLLAKMQKKARYEAELEAKKSGLWGQEKLALEARWAGEQAAKKWRSAGQSAADDAATWKKRGDEYSAEALKLVNEATSLGGTEADPMSGEANRHMAFGDYKGAQGMMVRAHKLADQAAALNDQAKHAWQTAQDIEATLPAYEREAQQEALHAEVVINPSAEAAAPLVTMS